MAHVPPDGPYGPPDPHPPDTSGVAAMDRRAGCPPSASAIPSAPRTALPPDLRELLGVSPFLPRELRLSTTQIEQLDPRCAPRMPTAPRPCAQPGAKVPDRAECEALWERFAMPRHIRAHSEAVAHVGYAIATAASRTGRLAPAHANPEAVLAACLLHDIAKDYTIRHGGNHSQLGAIWTLEAAGDAAIAQGIMHHVYWPWALDADASFLPLTLIYADKRVRHDSIVPLVDRFSDLLDRYGKTEDIRARIHASWRQAEIIAETLSEKAGFDVDAHSFTGRRLV